MIAHGPRVTLRPLTTDDVEPGYLRWMNDPEVTKHLESRFVTHTAGELRHYVAAAAADPDTYFFAIIDETQRHIGNIKLGPVSRRHAHGDIGIIIGERDAWGRGYATESITVLCEFAFTTLALHKVTAGAYSSNAGSIAAFRNAGFRVEGARLEQYWADGEWVDGILLGRLATA